MTKNSWNSSNPVEEAKGGTAQATYTKGDILYASAANTLSKLAVGTSNHVSYVNTDIPGYKIGVPGSKVLISTQTASGASTVDFTSVVDSSKYSYYIFVFREIKASVDNSATDFQLVVSVDNGANYLATGYNWVALYSGPGYSGEDDNTADSRLRFWNFSGTSTGEGGHGEIYFFPSDNPSVTYNILMWDISVLDNTPDMVKWDGCGYNTTSSAINAFRFSIDNSSTISGVINMYGICK